MDLAQSIIFSAIRSSKEGRQISVCSSGSKTLSKECKKEAIRQLKNVSAEFEDCGNIIKLPGGGSIEFSATTQRKKQRNSHGHE